MTWATIIPKQYNHVTGITPDVVTGSKVIDAYWEDGNLIFIWLWNTDGQKSHRKHVLLTYKEEGPINTAGFPRYEYQNIIIEMPDNTRRYLFEVIGEDLHGAD